MEYKYTESTKDPKIHIVSDKDGRLYVRKDTHIDSQLARRLTEISCPRIVKFIEFGEDDKGEYVIEEYVEGVTAAESSFTRKQAVRVLFELCDALEALHSAKIVHRDIKPSNIIITPDGHIKLIDFDAARIEKAVKDRDTQILGTEGFAPPEQFGFSQTDSRSDIYSFGVTMNMILGENSAPFINIIKKCKALDPNDRYDSISGVKTAIRLAMLKRFAAIPAAALLLVIFTAIFATVLRGRDQADHIGNSYLESYISTVSDATQPPVDSQSEIGNESDNSSSESNSNIPPESQTSQSSEPPRSSEPAQSSEPPQSSEPAQSSEPPRSSEPAQSSEPPRSSEPAQSSEPPRSSEPAQSSEPPRSSEPAQSSEPPQSSEPSQSSQPPETSNDFYHTVINEYGYYDDVCDDYTFYDDPSVHGEWKVFGLINKNDMSYFLNGRTDLVYRPEKTWIKSLDLNADGTAVANGDWNSTWTKGYIILDNTYSRTIDELYSVNVVGIEYLLMENKTGDYLTQGFTDSYFIFTRTGTVEFTYTTTINDKGAYEDYYNYWFTDAPELHGTWKIAGTIKSVRYEQWLNGKAKMTPTDYSWMNNIELCPDGSAILNNGEMHWLWTNGYLVRTSNSKKTVSALSIVNVNGTEYLTVENKNGDYTRTGKIISYCVYTREAD